MTCCTCKVCGETSTKMRSFFFFSVVALALAEYCAGSVPCPGGTSVCPSGNTCCMTASGQFGCCPLVDAVCCSDHTHCCPNDYTCDVSQGTCTKGAKVMEMVAKRPALKTPNVICPGGTAQCPSGNTCCMTASGQYGCCPLPTAVCCSDHTHCCPQGYTCDVSQGTCTKGAKVMEMVAKRPALKTPNANVICPGGTAQCPSGNTCCMTASGQYGCCPLPTAVCCSDHTHCCPQGYTCDVSQGTCTKGAKVMEMVAKRPALKTPNANVVCPGGTSQCPSGNTCCMTASGQYGCCPLPTAVCCSDHTHCCPQGYTCDVSQGTCTKGAKVMEMVAKRPALKTPNANVICPGGTAQCPSGNTCCMTASGQYGCCPLPTAVCCSDHIHCCPQGYTCDDSSGTCSKMGKKKTLPSFLLGAKQDRRVL